MNTKSSSTTLVNKYNEQYAWAVTNVTTRQGKPATEQTLIWAHLYAHTATYGVKTRSPYDTTLPRISASGRLQKTCGRCNGTGLTSFTHIEAGRCFECEGSGDSAHPYPKPASQRVERDHADALEDSYPWQYCDQCGNKTSWRTNEHARVANTLVCRSCNDANASDSVVCTGSGPEFYPDENQWMPCDTCGGDCRADVSFDNGALEEACRVCGCSPDTHVTVRVDHAYQQGWRNASAA